MLITMFEKDITANSWRVAKIDGTSSIPGVFIFSLILVSIRIVSVWLMTMLGCIFTAAFLLLANCLKYDFHEITRDARTHYTDAVIHQGVYLYGRDTQVVYTIDGLKWHKLEFIANDIYEQDGKVFLVGDSHVMIDDRENFVSVKLPSAKASVTYQGDRVWFMTKDRYVYIGSEPCGLPVCSNQAYYSPDHGQSWVEAVKNVVKCEYPDPLTNNLICLNESGELYRYDVVENESRMLVDDCHGFEFSREWLIVARKRNEEVYVQVTRDLLEFHEPEFVNGAKSEAELFVVLNSGHNLQLYRKYLIEEIDGLSSKGFEQKRLRGGKIFEKRIAGEENKRFERQIVMLDSFGRTFEATLENVNQQENVEFEAVKGSPGVYFVNVEMNGRIQTRRSVDNGKTWHSVEAKGIGCESTPLDCFVHLKLNDELAVSESPLIVVGIGNIGQYLQEEKVLLSLDGGMTFNIISDSIKRIKVFDNVMLMTDLKETREIQYSKDHGKTYLVVIDLEMEECEELIEVKSECVLGKRRVFKRGENCLLKTKEFVDEQCECNFSDFECFKGKLIKNKYSECIERNKLNFECKKPIEIEFNKFENEITFFNEFLKRDLKGNLFFKDKTFKDIFQIFENRFEISEFNFVATTRGNKLFFFFKSDSEVSSIEFELPIPVSGNYKQDPVVFISKDEFYFVGQNGCEIDSEICENV
ncbi:hypothetical protein ROZALSC1DRAFT_30647, partial [Rozella allomycis CSF55]